MRPFHCLPGVPAALLLAIFPLIPLLAQEDDAMKKDQPSAEGKLVGADNHRASGTVHIVTTGGKRQLHFTPDFSSERGPDVYITLTNGPKPVDGPSVVIARLTKFSGEQSFELPTTADLSKYSHLVLWCRKYNVGMAVAKLTSPGSEKMDGRMDKEDAMKGKEDAMMEKDQPGSPPTSKPD